MSSAAWPKSARALLESRYQAFVSGDVDFIINSHHPENRSALDRNSIESWSKESKWEGLSIEDESIQGEKTYIRFLVRYTKDNQTFNHRENAEFRLTDGKWFYFDSEFPKPETVKRDGDKTGRNDPCHCGSGKKFKKCHGLAA